MSTALVDLDRLAEITYLAAGAHDATDDEKCLLEAVAYVAGLPHSDRPACTSPVLSAFGRRLNDVLPDALRQELLPLVPRLVGTAGDGLDEQRGYLALDWLIRTYTPAWLELAGLASEASALRELGRIVDVVSAERARPVVRSSREKAGAARAAFWDAAAWTRDLARDARDAARAAAGAVAWDVGDAGTVAWDVGDAGDDAARDAAWAAARAAWDGGDDAWAALAPTVTRLQRSAIELFDRMITAA